MNFEHTLKGVLGNHCPQGQCQPSTGFSLSKNKTAVVPNPPGTTAASHSETPRLHYGRFPGKWGMLQGQAAQIV